VKRGISRPLQENGKSKGKRNLEPLIRVKGFQKARGGKKNGFFQSGATVGPQNRHQPSQGMIIKLKGEKKQSRARDGRARFMRRAAVGKRHCGKKARRQRSPWRRGKKEKKRKKTHIAAFNQGRLKYFESGGEPEGSPELCTKGFEKVGRKKKSVKAPVQAGDSAELQEKATRTGKKKGV